MCKVEGMKTYTFDVEYELPGWDEFNYTSWETVRVTAMDLDSAMDLLAQMMGRKLILNVRTFKVEDTYDVLKRLAEEQSRQAKGANTVDDPRL